MQGRQQGSDVQQAHCSAEDISRIGCWIHPPVPVCACFSQYFSCGCGRAFPPVGILPASCSDFGLVFGKSFWGVESGASRKQLAGGTRALQMVNLPAFM